MRGLDQHLQAPLVRVRARVRVLAEVFPRQPVDLLARVLGRDVRRAADRDPLVRIGRVDQDQRDARGVVDVTDLLASFSSAR